jgi:hypothetical protein
MHLGYQNVDCNSTAVWINLIRIVHIKDLTASDLNWASLSAAIVPMICGRHQGIFPTLWPSSSIFRSSFIAKKGQWVLNLQNYYRLTTIPTFLLSRLSPLLLPPISCPFAWQNVVVNKGHSIRRAPRFLQFSFLAGVSGTGFWARNFGQKIAFFGHIYLYRMSFPYSDLNVFLWLIDWVVCSHLIYLVCYSEGYSTTYRQSCKQSVSLVVRASQTSM